MDDRLWADGSPCPTVDLADGRVVLVTAAALAVLVEQAGTTFNDVRAMLATGLSRQQVVDRLVGLYRRKMAAGADMNQHRKALLSAHQRQRKALDPEVVDAIHRVATDCAGRYQTKAALHEAVARRVTHAVGDVSARTVRRVLRAAGDRHRQAGRG
jgi:hypothetical protein